MIRIEHDLTVTGWGGPEDYVSVLDPIFPRIWTSRLGPTAVCAVQVLAADLFDDGAWHESITVAPEALARQLGLTRSVSKLQQTIDRLSRFGWAILNDHSLSVRVTCPRIPARMFERFAPRSVEAYQEHQRRLRSKVRAA